MMEWITVIALIVVGLLLIVAEVIFIPGGIVGIVGLIFSGFGIYLSFTYFGNDVGLWVTLASTVLFGVSLYFSFKKGAWDLFSLKGTIGSKVNEGLTSKLKPGDEGVALSTLKPIGKAEFEGVEHEVRSKGEYIESGTTIRIIRIENNNIFVEPIK